MGIQINGETYQIYCEEATATVTFAGTLRLSGPKTYREIETVLNGLLERSPQTMTLDLQPLKFLNSSGISMLSKFVVKVRNREGINLVVLASSSIPWQKKSLKNLQRLMPGLELRVRDGPNRDDLDI